MKILICLDYGNAAKTVLRQAFVYVKAFPQAEIYLYNVIDSSLIADGCEYSSIESDAAELEKITDEVFDGRKFSFEVETGNPAERIIHYTHKINCDLLILGTHGRTGMSHLMTGSVAEHVLRNVACNTMVIPVKNRVVQVN